MAKETINNLEQGSSVRTKLNNMFTELYAAIAAFIAGHTIQQSGTSKPKRSKLNFIGAIVTDDEENDTTTVTITGGEGGGGGGHTIQDGGTDKTQRTKLNFIGFTVADDEPNDATKITAIPTDISGKVDKVSGYSLTKNDLTDLLKTAYDACVTWISTNGTNILNHIGIIAGNPHGTTKTDIGLVNCDNTSDANKPVSTATQTALDLKANKSITINSPTDSYELVLTDAGKNVRMGKGTAQNLTIPLNSAVEFPTGTQILVSQSGAGQVTFVPTAGVTINSVGARLKIAAQYCGAVLTKVDTNTWSLMGDLIT
jgi:hypothetical protein